jgi:hypothetical protein
MDITVYLPDGLGKRAKDAGINLSATLRAAVADELDRRDAMEKLADGAKVYHLDLQTPDGASFTGRITGKLLAETDRSKGVYATDDGRIIIYDRDDLDYSAHDADSDDDTLAEMLSEMLPVDDAVAVLARLGRKATVDL